MAAEKRTEMSALLFEAARLVEEARNGLNVKRTSCTACAHERYESFDDWQADQALEAAVARIKRVAKGRAAAATRGKEP